MLNLLKTHKVTLFKRSTSGGYLNDNHEWVSSSFQSPITFECNIQPVRRSKKKLILPDGIRTEHTLILRSKTPLSIGDHINNQEGDEVEYNGNRYEILDNEDWSGYGLLSDHYEYLIVRKDRV